jgi:hypothetical protein
MAESTHKCQTQESMNIWIRDEGIEASTETNKEGGPQEGNEKTAWHQEEKDNEEGPSNDHMFNQEGKEDKQCTLQRRLTEGYPQLTKQQGR